VEMVEPEALVEMVVIILALENVELEELVVQEELVVLVVKLQIFMEYTIVIQV
jgi:hypothetical protein